MITLYIVSTESFSGKTALCYGIATRLKRDGMRLSWDARKNSACR